MARKRTRRHIRRELPDETLTPRRRVRLLPALALVAVALSIALVWTWWRAEQFDERFDADYVGSTVCGDCHSIVHAQWVASPHANMVRSPSPGSVIGRFDNGEFRLPADSPDPLAGEVVARTYVREGRYFMALRHPGEPRFVEFPIELVVGYQYRQEYLTREAGGVLRRLPLQWSTARDAYFPYWNVQEGSAQTVNDLWQQMGTLHSAWNLYCARCHTTNLDIRARDAWHTVADVGWKELGIGCEACHGPGSKHVEYMKSTAANRLAMFVQNHLRGRPVAYIASASKLPKGEALSVCARCHGADIFARHQDIYRVFEPGYSREGRINDLSDYFRETPLTPGRMNPTVEVWHNGRPRGIGMLFRSFVESTCFDEDEVRCFDCHNPHHNKLAAKPGLLQPSAASDAYCGDCHQDIAAAGTAHTQHVAGQPGSHCYDCHMPRHITKLNRGVWERTRTHEMSSLPNPQDSLRHGIEHAPNACADCHEAKGPQWAVEAMERMWPGSTGRGDESGESGRL
ncbi:MAG TPA: multiheme c-type cytochrome [Xanthomonadaceae bacterium]|nr:multiheme c-type cytochrome [Xanthomonadaceae bacterium]